MKYKKVLSFLQRILPFCLIILIFCLLFFLPREREVKAEEKRVVCVWNVDTFEGGVGSRTTFLKKVASRVQKSREGVYYLVSNYSKEGAISAFQEGIFPDILSFGVGLSIFEEYALPLPYHFIGGESRGVTRAYPWYMGKYFLFSLDENFEEEGNVAISCGGENLSSLCAYFAEIKGEEIGSTEAYVGFLNKKYRYLLGTQRDERRFLTRGVTVFRRELSTYCDLFGYVSILNAQKESDALAFLEELRSPQTQEDLASVGLYPPQTESESYLLGAFTPDDTLQRLALLAREGAERKNITKFLKSI